MIANQLDGMLPRRERDQAIAEAGLARFMVIGALVVKHRLTYAELFRMFTRATHAWAEGLEIAERRAEETP